jgi:hypothetical protein
MKREAKRSGAGDREGTIHRPRVARIMPHMPAGFPKPPLPILSTLMLLCALVVIGLAIAGTLQLRATRAPVAVVSK